MIELSHQNVSPKRNLTKKVRRVMIHDHTITKINDDNNIDVMRNYYLKKINISIINFLNVSGTQVQSFQ